MLACAHRSVIIATCLLPIGRPQICFVMQRRDILFRWKYSNWLWDISYRSCGKIQRALERSYYLTFRIVYLIHCFWWGQNFRWLIHTIHWHIIVFVFFGFSTLTINKKTRKIRYTSWRGQFVLICIYLNYINIKFALFVKCFR